MVKRKICFLAVLLATVYFCLIFIFKVDFLYSMPEVHSQIILTGKLNKIENKTFGKYLFLEGAKGKGETSARSFGRVILFISSDESEYLDIKLGNKIRTKCIYTGFNKARNRGNFDEKRYYASLGISGKFEVKNHKDLEVIDKSTDFLGQFLYALRLKIMNTFEQAAGGAGDKAGIFSAIVAGEKQNLESDTKNLYQKNGIAHVLAVSGLHISFIGMGLLRLLRKFLMVRPACIISGAVMILFCIMTGGSVSAVRATVMFLLRLFSMSAQKQFDMITAVGVASILLLISNPNYIFNSGFLLSFGSVCAIATLSDVLVKTLETQSKFAKGFFASLSITLFTLPIIMNTYYEIPLFSILLNMVIVPVMSFVLGSGIFGGAIGMMSIALARFVIGLSVYLLSAIEILCMIIDFIPCSVMVTGCISPTRFIIYYGILVSGTVVLNVAFRKKIKVKKVIMGAFLCAMLVICFINPRPASLQIFVFDVDQGDGILIRTPGGTVYLIDGGSATLKNVYDSRLESAIKYRGISTIDYSIITHTDTDHISGVMSMLDRQGAGSIKINNMLLPYIAGNEKYEELIDKADKAGTKVRVMYRGMSFTDGDIKIDCLYPQEGFSCESVNGYSTVLSLEYGDFKALFTGDLDETGEDYLISKGLKGYDMLKVAHHGSRYSSKKAFIDSVFDGVKEPVAVISAGVNNSYGHPHKETLERLEDVNADVYCTAWCGEIMLDVNKTQEVKVHID